MLKFYSTVLFVSCLLASACFAQRADSLSHKRKECQAFKTILSFNPLGLIDPLSTNLSGGLEIFVANRYSLRTEMSHIFSTDLFRQMSRHDVKGYIFRPSVRWYYHKNSARSLELVFHYRQDKGSAEIWEGKNYVNGNPAYLQYEMTTIKRERMGFILLHNFRLTEGKTRLNLDVYAGVGVKLAVKSTVNGVADEIVREHYIVSVIEPTVTVHWGFRVQYTLIKFRR